MPYMPTSTFDSSDYAPQYLQPKFDGPLDFHHVLHPVAATEADLDPYNHSKHASAGPMFTGYQNYYSEHQLLSHQIGAHMIPPLQVDSRYATRPAAYPGRSQYDTTSFQKQPAQDEKIVGGVSAQLDYDMEPMVDFVVEMALAVVHPPSYDRVLFRKWVLQVLNATRLPSATIVLSLSYLAMRVNSVVASRTFHPTERGLYQMLTVALILGSKFLDDNTFQNKSWAEVSNIAVKELNSDEMEWLKAFQFRLHLSPDIPDGFAAWQAKWTSFKTRPVVPMLSLLPIDTTRRPRSSRQDASPSGFPRQYTSSAMSSISLEQSYTPTYSPYQSSWYGQRSASNRSPSTAPHSGPNTPDHYTSQSRWGQVQSGAATRDNRLGYSSLPQLTPDLGIYQASYDSAIYGHGYSTPSSVWSLHGNSCQCSNCRQSQLLQPRFGPLMAA